ncbi:unnamed protein product [Sphagnum tenellum]
MPICISRAVFSFSRVTTGPKTRRYVKCNKIVFIIGGGRSLVTNLQFLLQFFEEDPMLLPHPADELSLTLEQPADEAFPSYDIKFGHMKTN